MTWSSPATPSSIDEFLLRCNLQCRSVIIEHERASAHTVTPQASSPCACHEAPRLRGGRARLNPRPQPGLEGSGDGMSQPRSNTKLSSCILVLGAEGRGRGDAFNSGYSRNLRTSQGPPPPTGEIRLFPSVTNHYIHVSQAYQPLFGLLPYSPPIISKAPRLLGGQAISTTHRA